MVGIHDFAKGFTEIPDQGAADASGIHFTDLDAGFFQESAVDADLSEFIFDQYDLLACKRLGEQLFDQCCLSGSEEAGNNIDFCHLTHPLSIFYFRSSSTGQWSDPMTSVRIFASASLSFRLSDTQK